MEDGGWRTPPRFLPEPEELLVADPSWEESSPQPQTQPQLHCVWSVRNKAFLCRQPASPWSEP